MAEHTQDPGFGEKYSRSTQRMIRPNGKYNVNRLGNPFTIKDSYLHLIEMSGTKFSIFALGSFVLLNLLFGISYTLIGEDALRGSENYGVLNDFLHAFFFSIQTFTTVGYGAIAPHSILANSLAGFEAFIGIIWAAIITGLLYGRFAKPSARIIFSKNALVSPFINKNALMFRVANQRSNVMMETEITVLLSILQSPSEGFEREYFNLELENRKIQFFPLNWTLVHPITSESPFWNKGERDLAALDAEILIMIKGFDQTFNQFVHTTHSYKADEILWGKKFTRMYYPDEEGKITIDLRLIDEYEPTQLFQNANEISEKEIKISI
jgi:inward rectifier potassium channel